MPTATAFPFLRYLLMMLARLALLGSVIAVAAHDLGGLDENLAVLAAPSRTLATPTSAPGPVVELLWETDGGPTAPLYIPAGATVDPQGNLWVTDGFNGWFVVFSLEGVVLETWGSRGSGEGEFELQCRGEGYGGVAFDAAGNIYVADAGNGRIQKFGPDRAFLTSWPSEGGVKGADSQLLVTTRGNEAAASPPPHCPVDIAIDGQGRVVVSDRDAGTIEVFAADGRPLITATVQAMSPEGIALDSDGNIWVADNGNRVLKFAPNGDLLETWDTAGSGDGELNVPMSIAVDAQGRVFVSDQGNRVQVFAPDGAFLVSWGLSDFGAGQFIEPVGLALDGEGHLYVVDHYGRVQKFRLLPPVGPG